MKKDEKNEEKIKRIVTIVVTVLLMIMLVLGSFSLSLLVKTNKIKDDYSSIFTDEKYQTPVYVEGIKVIKQDVSCGYAVLEMFSSFCGGDVTEKSLYEEYGKVVTSTGKAFCKEMNKRFPQYKTTMKKYLTNTELLDAVYDSLSRGMPVPFEWAAQLDGVWTLHYSLIIGIDVPANKITVANPYGYIETPTIDEFLSRTTFEAYQNMPVFLKLGFAFGIFEKNTVFVVTPY